MRTIKTISLSILLLLAAAAALGQPHPNNERGFQADKVYQFGGIDQVNVYNGNLMVQIPLVSNKVSSSLSYDLTLTYSSKVWDYVSEYVEHMNNSFVFSIPNRRSNAGVGWMLSLGTIYGPSNQHQTGPQWWTYESPDGAEHRFAANLHNVDPGPIGSAAYTRDNTYLRMRTLSSTIIEIDFPDGQTHKFEASGTNNTYRLIEMRDRFNNWVRVNYNPWPGSVRCTDATSFYVITDSAAYGRQTDVCLKNQSYDGKNRPSVNEVVVSTFGGGVPARYKLGYTQKTTPHGCERTWLSEPYTASLPQMTKVTLPDGSAFDLAYHSGTGWCSHANLITMWLPTGGRYEYDYTDYRMPVSNLCGDAHDPGWLSITPGIHKKRIYDESNVLKGEWTYAPSNDPGPGSYTCWGPGEEYLGEGSIPPEEHITLVTSPDKDQTWYYFSIWPGWKETDEPSPDNGYSVYDYGLPFSKKHVDPTGSGGYLSSEVYDCDAAGGNCQVKQKTYVIYEKDNVFYHDRFDANRRLKRQRVVWTSDGNKYYDINNDSFDGYGHYRTRTASGDFGNGVKDVTKTTSIDYNPGTDQYGRINGTQTITSGEPWLLNLFTESKLYSGGTVESKTQVCFDQNTGFLRGKRTFKNPYGSGPGAGDVVELFTPDWFGYVGQEDYFGGDLQDTSGLTNLCSFAEGSRYRMTYTYSAGELTQMVRHRSTGAREAFLTERSQIVDPHTGVVSSSTDSTGLTTTYGYDTSRRLISVTTPGTATTSYNYKKRGEPGYPLATVLVDVTAASPTDNSQRKIEYDGLGRIRYESRQLPDGTAKRETRYDAMGRKSEVSEWESVPSHFTRMTFDFLGRVTNIYAPDYTATNNHVTSLTYTGARQTQRTVPIGTTNSGSTVFENPVTVTEKYDIHNRLLEIQEYDITTLYKYDLSDRLVEVQQNGWDRQGWSTGSTRSFTYDARGFMTRESHPESNAYDYLNFDAKGHAWKQNQGNVRDVFDLEFEFDDAERLTKVFSRNPYNPNGPFRLSKHFVFDTGNNHGRSNGKLIQAIRHNYNPGLGDVVVTESLSYDNSGRPTNKTTLITNATYNTTYQQFSQTFSYNDLGDQVTMGYPTCQYAACGQPAIGTLSRTYSKGVLKGIPGYIDNITYWPNGLYNTITHSGTTQVVDTQVQDDSGLSRPKSISFGNATWCTSPTITQPADKSIQPGTSTSLTVSAGGNATLSVTWYLGWANDRSTVAGTGTTLNTGTLHATTRYWAEVTNSCGRASTLTITVSMCGTPSLSGPAPVTIEAGTNTVLTVTVSGGSGPYTYEWFKGTTLVRSINTSATSDSYPTEILYSDTTYKVRVTNSCNAWAENSVVVTVTCAAPVLSGPAPVTIAPNTRTNLTVSASGGVTPYTYQWFIGTTQVGLNSPSYLTEYLTSSTTYRVRVTSSCGAWAERTVNVTVAAPPSGLVVTSTSSTRLDLAWNASSSVSYYEVWRKVGTSGYTPIATPTTNSWPDQSITTGNVAAYLVRAIHNDGTASDWTNVDIGTTFTLTTLQPFVTAIDDAHLRQLRDAIGALRTTANLGAYTWTDEPPVPGTTPVRAAHLTQLRTALNEARQALGVPQLSFTDPTLVAGQTFIRAVHWSELQNGCR